MTVFKTLLLREWMQHKRGWLVVLAIPLLVGLAVLAAGQIRFDIDGSDVVFQFGEAPALALATLAIVCSGALAFVLAWFVALFQTPGLARRDQQDRSIEFWLSLPTGHTRSLVAPLLAHLLLFPLAALAIGTVTGLLVSLPLVARFAGVGEWFALPWGTILAVWVSLLLRIALGLLLATLWLSPLILLVMAASAWLKRWGLPALIAGSVLISGVLDKLFGNPVLSELGRQLIANAGRSFVSGRPGGGLVFKSGTDPLAMIQGFPGRLAGDAWGSIQLLASPLLLLALAVSGACFALLILRRRQGN